MRCSASCRCLRFLGEVDRGRLLELLGREEKLVRVDPGLRGYLPGRRLAFLSGLAVDHGVQVVLESGERPPLVAVAHGPHGRRHPREILDPLRRHVPGDHCVDRVARLAMPQDRPESADRAVILPRAYPAQEVVLRHARLLRDFRERSLRERKPALNRPHYPDPILVHQNSNSTLSLNSRSAGSMCMSETPVSVLIRLTRLSISDSSRQMSVNQRLYS